MYSLFSPILKALGWLLAQFYSVIPNLGISIILLTILIMFVLYPLTSKQTRSMMAMQRVQPEIKKLQAKYKNDRQKMNEEMMKFYQENKINPLAGCLPLLLQMPILISLFGVLRKAYDYVPKSSKLYQEFCNGFGVNGAPKCGVEATGKVIDRLGGAGGLPKGVVKGEPLLHHLHFLGLDLQKSATAHHNGFGDAFPYFLLVALVIISYVASSRQAQKRTPAANKQMGAVMKILPPFFGLISVGLPSGLVLYLFVSSVFRVGQQEVIFRRHGHLRHAPVKGAIDVKSTEKGAPKAQKTAPPPEEIEEAPAPAPEVRQPARPKAQPTPVPQGRARGLRGALSLPPPPSGNGDVGGSAGAAKAASGAGAAQRKRRNKKKRKR